VAEVTTKKPSRLKGRGHAKTDTEPLSEWTDSEVVSALNRAKQEESAREYFNRDFKNSRTKLVRRAQQPDATFSQGFRGGNATDSELEYGRLALWVDKLVSEALRRGIPLPLVESHPEKAGAATRIGQNIERFRKDCGWSLNELADKTGIDKKQVVSHVNAKSRPHPRNLKVYADALSKGLGTKITVNDLER
jgi:helix-turn-helix protein